MPYRSSPPQSYPPSFDVGQRITSAFVDVVFFCVVGALGWQKVLSEPTLAVLFGSYASYRFGIAAGKQQTLVAFSRGDGSGTGGSGKYPQASAPRVPHDPRVDPPWEDPPTPPRRGGRLQEDQA